LDQSSADNAAPGPQPLTGWRAASRDFVQMVRFYSRIPMPKLPFEADAHAIPDFTAAARMLPLAGLVIGLPSALTLWLAATLGLPALISAAIAVAVAVLATGAFHEDGLADTFDGLGGGWTPERRLEIMKDSRIGSYGGAALILALILRVAAISALLDETTPISAGFLVLAAAGLSRTMGLTPIAMLPPARSGGLSSTVGRPTMPIYGLAIMLSLFVTGGLIELTEWPLWGAAIGIVLGLVLTTAMTYWSLKTIHGQTGDIAGACQQFSEIAFYLGLIISI
jgi:adenosylcobinamide-GDP ribazoletransferase